VRGKMEHKNYYDLDSFEYGVGYASNGTACFIFDKEKM